MINGIFDGVRQSARCAVAVVGLLMSATAASRAQTAPFVSATTTGRLASGGSNVGSTCLNVNRNLVLPNTSASANPASCTIATGITGAAAASAVIGGPLRAFTTVTANVSLPANQSLTQTVTSAEAYWGDVLTFAGAAPAFVDFTVHEDGTLANGTSCIGVPGCLDSYLLSYFGTNSVLGSNCTSATSATSPSPFIANSVKNIGGYSVAQYEGPQAVNSSRTVRCSVNPSGFLGFSYRLLAAAVLQLNNPTANAVAFNSSATVDFSSTAFIMGLQFYNAAGQDISSDVRFTSAAGAQYTVLLSTVPEPTTVFLLAIGLTGIMLISRRRRRLSA